MNHGTARTDDDLLLAMFDRFMLAAASVLMTCAFTVFLIFSIFTIDKKIEEMK